MPAEVVQKIGDAFARDGFIYATNHGLSSEQIHRCAASARDPPHLSLRVAHTCTVTRRQFSIAQHAFDGVSEADKARYAAKILEEGDFTGYKPRGHWKLRGVRDQIEHFSLGGQSYTPERREKIFPPALAPLVDEIEEFTEVCACVPPAYTRREADRTAQYNHDHIYRKILTVLSLVLKLPPNALWDLASNKDERFDLFRYALYHPPSPDEDVKTDGVRLQGHTDFNAVSREFAISLME